MLWAYILSKRTKRMTHDKRKAFAPKQDAVIAAHLITLAQEALKASSVRAEHTSNKDGEIDPTRHL